MKKTVLITGVAGFIGYHLAKTLTDEYNVIGIDNLQNSGYSGYDIKTKRLSLLKNVVTHEFDCGSEPRLSRLIEEHRPDIIIHLAASPGVRFSHQAPGLVMENNVHNFTTILESCRKNNIKLLYASSSSVYGENAFQSEAAKPCPISVYGMTKAINDMQAEIYSKSYGMDIIGMRFFTVYGPLGRPDMMIKKLFHAAYNSTDKEKIVVPVFNNGKNSRSFTYIDDIVDAIRELITLDSEGHDIFNLGSDESYSTLELINKVIGITGKEIAIEMQGKAEGDVLNTHAYTTYIKLRTGWKPKISLDEGLMIYNMTVKDNLSLL